VAEVVTVSQKVLPAAFILTLKHHGYEALALISLFYNTLYTFKVFWEMEQCFDGATLQYSLNDGAYGQTLVHSMKPLIV